MISKEKSSNEITNVWISFIIVSSKSHTSNLHHLFLLNKSCLKNFYTGVENDATHPHVTNVEIFSRIASTEISANIEIIVLDDSGNNVSCRYTFSSLCRQEPKINYNLFISKPLTIFLIKFFTNNDQIIHAWIFLGTVKRTADFRYKRNLLYQLTSQYV